MHSPLILSRGEGSYQGPAHDWLRQVWKGVRDTLGHAGLYRRIACFVGSDNWKPLNDHPMYLEKLLAEEHSKKQCDRIVQYIGRDKPRFAELMRLFFKGEHRITQRAAWPLSYVVRRHPELITPYFGKLLDNLDKDGLHIAVVRNTIRLLQDVDIPAKFHGRVMNRCFEYVGNPATPIAVKAFSLTVLQNLSEKYPDILPELKLIIREQWDQAPPAFRVRAKRILKDLC